MEAPASAGKEVPRVRAELGARARVSMMLGRGLRAVRVDLSRFVEERWALGSVTAAAQPEGTLCQMAQNARRLRR